MEVAPDPLGSAGPLESQWAPTRTPSAQPPRFGRVHVIPADQYGSSPQSISRAVYRVFEIVLASIGLIVGLPLIVIAAVIVRVDSPGAALFRHKRPARSVCVRGRDLMGRPDFIPPPGGYRPDAQYYVPSYFTLVKLRTMYADARTRFPAYYAYRFSQENFHSSAPDDPGRSPRHASGTVASKTVDRRAPEPLVRGERRHGPGGPSSRGTGSAAILHSGGNGEIHPEARNYRISHRSADAGCSTGERQSRWIWNTLEQEAYHLTSRLLL